MKILEIKNNLVKVTYTPQDNMVISGFVIIEDSKAAYVAQIMSLKADSGINYAIVKLMFTFNEVGVVKNYNGSIPELNANVTSLATEELLDILPIETPLTIGKLAQQNFILKIDFSALEKNLLICSDNAENSDILLSNLVRQIHENNSKSLVFDTTGYIKSDSRLVLGQDFKLPLNYETINFIYEHDLADVEPATKAVIQEILLEVQEYANTLIDKFIPFDSFINVIDSQYKQLNLPELALLKGRLIKYKEENVFAQDAKDIQVVRASLRANLTTVIDISSFDSKVQKLAMSTVFDEATNSDLYLYNIVKFDNDNTDKKLIKKFLANEKIYTTVLCPHNFKYIHELKEISQNYIMFAPQTIQHDFGAYNVYLNKLNSDECVIFGKSTQNIPLIVEMMSLEDLEAYVESISGDINQESKGTEDEPKPELHEDFTQEADSYDQETMIEDTAEPDKLDIEDNADEISENNDEESKVIEEPEIDSGVTETESLEELQESPVTEKNINEYTEAAIEDIVEETVVPDEIVAESEESVIEEALDTELSADTETGFEEEVLPEQEQIIEDTPTLEPEVTDVFETPQQEIIEDNNIFDEQTVDIFNEESSVVENAQLPQDNLTEDDLDFIDNVQQPQQDSETENVSENNIQAAPEEDIFESNEFEEQQQTFSDDMDEFSNTEEQQEPQEQSEEDDIFPAEVSPVETDDFLSDDQSNIVPIYPASEETPINGVPEMYEPGDRVRHPKYGEGVVEKMVKFGDKVLCSINFANGRRLLDPTISQIEKI